MTSLPSSAGLLHYPHLHPDAALLAVRDGGVEEVAVLAKKVGAVAEVSIGVAIVSVTADLSKVHMADLVFRWISQARLVTHM